MKSILDSCRLLDSGAASLPRLGDGACILDARRARAGALPLLRLVWRLRPDVILSGAAEVSFLALLLRPLFPPRTRVLVRQNGTVSSALASRQRASLHALAVSLALSPRRPRHLPVVRDG